MLAKNEKMVGVWLEVDLIEKLDLLTIGLNTNRSAYIRVLLQQMIKQQPIHEIIKVIVDNAKGDLISPKVHFKTYVIDLKQILVDKNISQAYIDLIILKLKEWKESEQ